MLERRLLILDDDPTIGQTIMSIAQLAGVDVRYTGDPDHFFGLVDAWAPTHIALDLVMPRMDGVEVIVQLARRGCSARLIITSGVGLRVLDAAGRSAAEHGLDIAGVLSKPFTPAALRGLLGWAPAAPMVAAYPAPAPAGAGPSAAAASGPEITVASLERALAQDEFVLHYQPKVDCATGRLAGLEALVRWQHREHGLVMPARFIELAESSGLIDPLTDRILGLALPWFASAFPARAAAGPEAAAEEVSLSVNVSARTLRDMQLADRIAERCVSAGVSPSRVILELTETSAMEDPVASLGLLTRLRMKGLHLSIDDFGTGFSSMLQLVRLPFSELKVDRSFVRTAARSQESRAVIRSIVELGRSLGLQCTAEGVEDEAALAYLREVGCDLAQGYLIARPMPGEQVPRWLAARESSPRR